MQTRRLRFRLAAPAFVACGLAGSWVAAHELQIDELRLWLPPTSTAIRGQITFDPELTRARDEDLTTDLMTQRAAARAVAFIAQQVDVQVNGQACQCDLALRELYVVGGAVGGDVVMFNCPLSHPLETLSVGVGDGFPALVVRVAGFATNSAGEQSVVVPRSSRSATFVAARPQVANAPVEHLDEPQRPGFEPQSRVTVLRQFVLTGMRHVLPQGLDHVLFVVVLTLGTHRRWRFLLMELSAFTLAHSITFALGAIGWVSVSARVVEPLIALSIAGMAVCNVTRIGGRHARLSLALGFGLVHGLGFASALSALSLPRETFLTALVGFNLGVEGAQLLVAAAVVGTLLLLDRLRVAPQPWLRWSSIGIGVVGLFWAVQRALGR